jgi:hypothetical protein
MTEQEQIGFIKNHYLDSVKSDEDKNIIEDSSNLSLEEFMDVLHKHEITRCPPDKPIDCGDGVCVAIGEVCPEK